MSLKSVSLFALLLIVLAFAGLKIYRKIKIANTIKNTLTSEHWIERYNMFLKQPPTTDRIVFFGNSLTESFDLSVFGDSTIINRGIAGDFTAGLLKRLDEVTSLQPSKLFIEIGINDLFEKVPSNEIIENYEKIIEGVKKASPKTKIYIQSNLPLLREYRGTSYETLNKIIRSHNERLKMFADKYGLTYINLYDHFAKDGSLDPHLNFDMVHLNNFGYEVWKEALIPYLGSAD